MTGPIPTPAPTNGTWSSNDSPAAPLASPTPLRSSLTFTGTFTDYFMYQFGVTSSRTGSRLWVNLGTMNWNSSGTVTDSKGAYALVKNKTVHPKPTYASSTALPSWTQLFVPFSSGC